MLPAQVVEASDVILEVLDARDPLGCRCADVERFVRRTDPSKKIVLLLNKIGARHGPAGGEGAGQGRERRAGRGGGAGSAWAGRRAGGT